jgi:hypothetical protein
MQSGELANGIRDLFLILHVELGMFVGVIRDNVLMGMIIHLNEVTERNLIVSLDPREYAR